jgi:hypothetical protein
MRHRHFSLVAIILTVTVNAALSASPEPAATDKPVSAPEETFQFVVVSDLQGGYRLGVFERAVQAIQTLQPSFVMCIGDLIGGKDAKMAGPAQQAMVTDEVLLKQWARFRSMLEPLGSRFYFTPGNHDYNYPSKAAVYKRHVGSPYYSFNYGECHFLVINTNDGPDAKAGISAGQLEFLKKDLQENEDVAHTFIFCHHPFFLKLPDESGLPAAKLPGAIRELRIHAPAWQQVEKLLGDRPRTVFAGHLHRYIHAPRKGLGDYYVLATTGGGMKEDAKNQFDHIVLVTVRRGAPSVALVKLDGFVPQDLVVESQVREELLRMKVK